jgi:hypothetical protein
MAFVTVSIETFEGASYVLPDMDGRIFEKVLLHEEMWKRLSSFTISNVSGACLVVPMRIIKDIRVDGEVKWTALTV